jgi:hypothetical protein
VESFCLAKGYQEHEIKQKGVLRKIREKDTLFDPQELRSAAEKGDFMPYEEHKRTSRWQMQSEAEKTHTGEAKWTNVSWDGSEMVSSHCSVVGFFIAYGPHTKKMMCGSRDSMAAHNLDWKSLPPLCRPDNLDDKNREIEQKRKALENKKEEERASGSGQAASSSGLPASSSGLPLIRSPSPNPDDESFNPDWEE